jgi:Na+/H+-dicarboxylate symporter
VRECEEIEEGEAPAEPQSGLSARRLGRSLALPKNDHLKFSQLQPPEKADLLGLFIPSNPFRALSNNFVPVVVLFSIALGVALMGIGGARTRST